VLDKILVDAAVEAGAELRERFTVQALVWDGDRVCGITGRSASGGTVTEHASIVIGADGLHSLVARHVDAPTYNVQPTFQCAYYSYWRDLPLDGVEFYPRGADRRGFGALPTHDGLTAIIVGWPHEAFRAFRADIEGNFLKTLELAPAFAERVRQGRREERFRGTAELPNFYRTPSGPGWALVGDAGYHKDPITAQGITDAFRDAELVAEAVAIGLSGQRPMEDALAAYERRRNEASLPLFELTCQFAAPQPPPPEQQRLFAALRHDQAQADRFLGTVAGTVPVPAFFAPENLARIVGGAQAPAA
jgi:flavin-dependent dehydrogenase